MVGDAKFEKLVRRESRQLLQCNVDVEKELPEVSEDEADLLESLEDEAANSKITLSFLIKLTSGCFGTAAILQCLEVTCRYADIIVFNPPKIKHANSFFVKTSNIFKSG